MGNLFLLSHKTLNVEKNELLIFQNQSFMKVFEVTNVTKTGDNAITTSCGTLIFQSTLAIGGLTNEAISLWIERQGAQNVYLANRTPLKDVVYSLLTENKTSI